MKKCYKCQVEKPLECFSKNVSRVDGLSGQCKECHKTLRREHYEANKPKILEQVKRKKMEYLKWYDSLKQKPCVDCNRTFPSYAMDFDHLNEKKFMLSLARKGRWSKEMVLAEISKCDLICAVCHRIRTYNRLHH